MTKIHPTAVIEPGAELAEGVEVEAYAVIKSGVRLKEGVVVKSHAYLEGNTTIGERTVIFPGARVGTKCQHRRFNGDHTFLEIGKDCEIREFVTINSALEEGSRTSIGDNCLIMAYAHVAHNCRLGTGVILTNCATLAGHVSVENYAIIGGMTPVHQYVQIGCYAFVGGLSRISHDVPPYTLVGGNPCKVGGLNLVGLKRRGFAFDVRCELTKAFRLVYRSGLHLEEALDKISEEVTLCAEVRHWLDFCQRSRRGLIGLRGITRLAADESEEFEDYLASDGMLQEAMCEEQHA
jgi:UDP-N-acetylglucosamine acyltransferase